MRALVCGAALSVCLLTPQALAIPPEDVVESQTAKIVFDDGRPASFAGIEINSRDGRRVGLTDLDGRLSLSETEFSDSEAYLTVRAPGLPETSITMAELRADALVLTLRPVEAAATADRIIVTGRRISRVFAPRALNRLSILTNPVARADPLLAVDTFAFSTSTEGSADLSLRGIRPSANRVYFNDIPLYETSRGSGVDLITRSGSVLNPGLVAEVEIYPSNPPVFLAGGVGGAVRLLPDTMARDGASAFVSTTGGSASITRIGSTPSRFVQAFTTIADLAPALALNPGLEETLDHFRSQSVGLFAQSESSSLFSVQGFLQIDREDGAYPVNLFGFEGIFTNHRERFYALGSARFIQDTFRIKLDMAVTFSQTRERFGNMTTHSTNRYWFTSVDVSGPVGTDLDLRFGADMEAIQLVSNGQEPLDPIVFDTSAPSVSIMGRESTTDVYAYAYAVRRFGDHTSVYLGLRQPVHGGGTGSQAGISLIPDAGRTRFTFAAGRYYGAERPRLATDGPIQMTRIDQVALDVSREFSAGTALLAVFANQVQADDLQPVRSVGAEASLAIEFTKRLDANIAFTHTSPQTNNFQRKILGESDLPFIIRANFFYNWSSNRQINIAYIIRSGIVTTDILGRVPSTLAPGFDRVVFGPLNDVRLDTYQSLDLNFVGRAEFAPGDSKPLVFIAVTNVLNRSNPRALAFEESFTATRTLNFPRRTVTAGLTWTF